MERARHRQWRHEAVRAMQRHAQPMGSMLTEQGARPACPRARLAHSRLSLEPLQTFHTDIIGASHWQLWNQPGRCDLPKLMSTAALLLDWVLACFSHDAVYVMGILIAVCLLLRQVINVCFASR